MAQRKVEIDKATEAELRAFARETLGIEIHVNAKHDTVLAKVKAAWDKPEILVTDVVAADQTGSRPVAVTDEQKSPEHRKVRIELNITEEPGGSEPVPVGVNGKVMLIPRGKPVEIPQSYFEVLQHAVEHRYEALPDGKGLNPIPRKVPKYPFQVLAPAA